MELNKYNEQLAIYRQEIDKIDHQLVELLVKRLDVVVNVGLLKKQANQPVLDKKREQLIIDKICSYCNQEEYKLPLAKIYQCIMDQAKSLE